jgi:hypothetical protein
MTERRCEACGAGCYWRRRTCRRCARLLCVFCWQATCESGHRGADVILAALPTFAKRDKDV